VGAGGLVAAAIRALADDALLPGWRPGAHDQRGQALDGCVET
jgi:hypothetical protein